MSLFRRRLPILVLGFIYVIASSIFFVGQRLHTEPFLGSGASVSSEQVVGWRERLALQFVKPVFSKEVLHAISAGTADMGPLSLEAFRRNNLSASWKINGVEISFENNVAFEAQKGPDLNHGISEGKTDISSGDDSHQADTPERQYRRQLREKRREERASDLLRRDDEAIVKLEAAAIEHARSLDTDVLGKYSVWRKENEKEHSDSMVRLMRDQIIMAKVYVSIAKMKDKLDLIQDVETQLEGSELALGEALADVELDWSAPERIKAMGQVLSKSRKQLYDYKLVTNKLRAMLQAADEELRTLKKQSNFLAQLAAKSLPDAIHCLSMHLTIDFYLLAPGKRRFPRSENLENPSLCHYALFSDNVLAASVVVNSTVMNAKDPSKHVFHVVTDKLNFGAISMWFLLNPPAQATIHVQNIDEFRWLNSSYCPVLRQLESDAVKEYYFKTEQSDDPESGNSNLKYRNPKYLSMLNHLRFYLPQIYPKLDKILFLDDDIVVQKDLTDLWSVDLHGKVNGAVETCGESFHRFDKYLNFTNQHIARNFDPNACGWAYGMNIFDLKEWKRKDITGIYHIWQNMNEDRTLWKLGTLPPGLITFYGLTHPLQKKWHVLGLGYNPSIDRIKIENAAVIHYNGNMKPWLEMAIMKYLPYWTKYIKHDDAHIRSCNLSRRQ